MAASPHLSQRIRDTLGNEAGQELIGILDKMSGDISDLRGDLAELRHEMQVGFGRIETAFERSLRDQTKFFFLAWAVLLAAIVGIYAR
jgi:hypothetical protein